MKKIRVFLNLDEEENWINGVQAAGYRLTFVNHILHSYTFVPLTVTDEFTPTVRLDFRDHGLSWRNYQDYRQLFNDSGWRLIGGSRHGGVQYFQQRRDSVDNTIFSDERSKQDSRRRYSRMGYFYGVLFLTMFFVLTHLSSGVNIFNFQSWYLTPGLWQMQGNRFWQAFWFETPWALLRVIPVYAFGVASCVYLGRAYYGGGTRN